MAVTCRIFSANAEENETFMPITFLSVNMKGFQGD